MTSVENQQQSAAVDAVTADTIMDAPSSTERDYTRGPISQAVIALAIPMVLEMLAESVFALVDIYWVSKLGAEAVTVVGLTEAVITLVYAVAIGFSMGATAVVARRIGEKDQQGAARTAGQVLWIGFILSALIGLAGTAFAEDIMALMGAAPDVVELGGGYASIMLTGAFTIIFLFLINGIFRGAGNAVIAMTALGLANAINIVLDPLLIFGYGPFPEMGVTGAAVATNIGRGIGVAYLLFMLFRRGPHLSLGWGHLRLHPGIMVNLFKVSAGGIFQFFIATASWVVLMRVMAVHGSVAVAGYTIAVRIMAFTFLPAWGLSNAAATLVGQNLGAKNPERAEQCVWKTVKYNFVFLASIAVILFTLGEVLMSFFTRDLSVIAYGVACLRIVAIGYGLFAVGMVLTQAFNGAGDTVTPTWINFICFWLIQIPLAYFASNQFELGPTGVFISITVAESLIAIIAYWQFRKGTWKQKVV